MTLNPTCTLVLDLELQCWDGPTPPGYSNDIIQIGIVKVDVRAFRILKQGRYYVRPQRMQISPYCTALTGITEQIVLRKGRPLLEVVNTVIRNFGPTRRQCLTWGDDKSVLDRELGLRKRPNPFHMLDLGWMYRSSFGIEQNLSLENALRSLGMEFLGRPHDTLDDAINTARVHMAMVKRMRQTPVMQMRPVF